MEPGSYKTIRLKKNFNLNGETGPRKKSKNKEAELALEHLLSKEEPDENTMIDLTATNEQYLEKNLEGTNSKQQTKQRVQETKNVVKSLLAALERNESQEREYTKQQAQHFLQT